MLLPVLYLIDSIIKNHPDSGYLEVFAINIVHTFCFVFEKVSIMGCPLQQQFMLQQLQIQQFKVQLILE